MLQFMRERSQGWVAGIIITIICITFALWGVENYLGGGDSADVLAKINGVRITRNEVNVAYERLRQEYIQQVGLSTPITTAMQQSLKETALQQLITQQVLAQATVNQHYRIGDEQLRAAVMQIPTFQINGQFSKERFQQILSNLLYTEQGFLAGLRQTLMISQAERGIRNSNFSLPNEINTAIKLSEQTRDIGYMLLSAQQFYPAIKLEDAEIKAYYEQHAQEFNTPAQVSINYIQLTPQAIAQQVKPTAEELTKFYQNNMQQFAEPTRWQVAHILIKLPKDASTKMVNAAEQQASEIVAKVNKANTVTVAAHIKDVVVNENEQIIQGHSDPAFAQVLTNLEVGHVSQPFRTTQGINIVKLNAVKKADILPFAQVEEKVKSAWQQQTLQQAFAQQLDKLTDLAYTNPDNLAPAAKALALDVQTTDFFTRVGGKTDITKNPKIIAAAFSDEVLKQNVNSNPIELKDGSVVVLRVKEYKPSKPLLLAEVQPQIEQALKKQKAQQELVKLGQKIVADLNSGQSPEQVAKEYKTVWEVKKEIGRKNTTLNNEVVQTAFSLPVVANKLSVTSVMLPTSQLAIVGISHVANGDLSKVTAAQRAAIATELQHFYGDLDYGFYVASLMKKAKIDKK